MDKQKSVQPSPARRCGPVRQKLTKNGGSGIASILNDDILLCVFNLLSQDPARREENQDWEWYAIAHVCHRWRTIALNSGTFWSNIVLLSTPLNVIIAQLRRSKDADLTLTCIQWDLTETPYQFNEKLNTVSAHKGRITDMYIKMHDSLCPDFRGLLTTLPPRLNALHFQQVEEPGDLFVSSTTVSLQNIFSLKDLRKLCIINIGLMANSLSNIPPLQNLVELRFSDVEFEWRHLRDIIHLCPNIANFTVVPSMLGPQIDDTLFNPPSYASLKLPFLQNLKIRRLTTAQMYGLVQNLNMPINSSWELGCLVPSTFGFQIDGDSFSPYKDIVTSLLSRYENCETLQVIMTNHTLEFRTGSIIMPGEQQDGEMGTTATAILHFNHKILHLDYQNDQRCAFLTQLIRETNWRKIKYFRFYFKSGVGEITMDKWVDLLASFDNLSSLEVLLPFSLSQSQVEFATALGYSGQRNTAIQAYLKNLYFKLTWYDEDFIRELKCFLRFAKYNSSKISKLRIEYPTEAMGAHNTDIQGLSDLLSEYVGELQVEMYRGVGRLYHSE